MCLFIHGEIHACVLQDVISEPHEYIITLDFDTAYPPPVKGVKVHLDTASTLKATRFIVCTVSWFTSLTHRSALSTAVTMTQKRGATEK